MSEFEDAFSKVIQILPEHFRTEDGFLWGESEFRIENGCLHERVTPAFYASTNIAMPAQRKWALSSDTFDEPRELLASMAFSLGVEEAAYYSGSWNAIQNYYKVHTAVTEIADWETAAHAGIVRIQCGLGSINFAAFDSRLILGCASQGRLNEELPNAEIFLQSERERIWQLHPPGGFMDELALPDSFGPGQVHPCGRSH